MWNGKRGERGVRCEDGDERRSRRCSHGRDEGEDGVGGTGAGCIEIRGGCMKAVPPDGACLFLECRDAYITLKIAWGHRMGK